MASFHTTFIVTIIHIYIHIRNPTINMKTMAENQNTGGIEAEGVKGDETGRAEVVNA